MDNKLNICTECSGCYFLQEVESDFYGTYKTCMVGQHQDQSVLRHSDRGLYLDGILCPYKRDHVWAFKNCNMGVPLQSYVLDEVQPTVQLFVFLRNGCPLTALDAMIDTCDKFEHITLVNRSDATPEELSDWMKKNMKIQWWVEHILDDNMSDGEVINSIISTKFFASYYAWCDLGMKPVWKDCETVPREAMKQLRYIPFVIKMPDIEFFLSDAHKQLGGQPIDLLLEEKECQHLLCKI